MKDPSEYPHLERLNELAAALREDTITDAEVAELDQMLSESPVAVDAWVEMSALAAELRHFHGRIQARTPEKHRRTSGRKRPFSTWLALAATVAVAGAAVFWTTRYLMTRPGPVVATLVRAEGGPVLTRNGLLQELAEGTPMHAAEYELRSGVLELRYPQGPVCIIEAPATFHLQTPEVLDLERGNLSARVPDGAEGFTVLTHGARIIDLGTEFAVSAGLESSEIHVFKGEVLVEPGEEPEPLRLTGNHASRIDHQSRTPSGIDVNPDGFLRYLDEPQSTWAEKLESMNPVVWYRLGVGRGLQIRDAAGDRDGHIVPGVGKRPHWAPGRFGGAFSLQGPEGGGYGMVPDYPVAMDGKLSVSAWVKAESRPRWASIAKNWPFGAPKGNGQFHFGLWEDAGTLEVHVNDAAGEEIGVQESTPLPLGVWHHVAFVMDGEMLRLYRNGEEVDSVECHGLSTQAPPHLGIGVKLDETGTPIPGAQTGFWHGRIDELAIFHRVLTPEEIRILANADQS